MRVSRLCGCILLVGLASCAAHVGEPAGDLESAIAKISGYVNSFDGLSVTEAKRKLGDVKIVDKTWNEDGVGGVMITATFPKYELEVYFSEGQAVTVSVQFMSD